MSEILKNTIWGESRVDGKYDYLINPKTIFNFLSIAEKRVVPEYQRPYSWEISNTKKLLEDILKCSQKDTPWYLGTIYSTKKGSSDSASSQVLDGQQRLTTIQLILNEFLLFFKLNDQIDYDSIDEELTHSLDQYKKDCSHCLVSRVNGKSQQRFQTEKITNKLLKDYILETQKAPDKAKLERKLKDLDSRLEDTGISSKTAKTLRASIKLIRNYYKSLVFLDPSAADGKKEIEDGLKDLELFVAALLHKLWVIEVPLVDEELSLEIFEGINNRGKQLDLLDKLQFRSLTKIEGRGSEIKGSWKDLYTKVENLISDSNAITSLFSSHSDFYKTFFLGINGIEESDPDVIVNGFETQFLNDYTELEAFFKHVNSAVALFQAIQSPLNNTFISYFHPDKISSAKGLLQVTRRTIIESKQARQLVVNLSYHYETTAENRFLIAQSLWNIVRLVYLKTVVRNEKSQVIRSHFNRIIKYANGDNSIYLRLLEALSNYNDTDETDDSDDDSTDNSSESEEQSSASLFELKGVTKNDNGKLYIPTINLFSPGMSMFKSSSTSSGNKTAKLVQYFIIKRFNRNSLEVMSGEMYAKEQLEHVFPLSYKQHWEDKVFTRDELVEKAEEILEGLNFVWDNNLIIDQIKQEEEEVALHNYPNKPSNSNESSVIEWHGNKIILGQRSNSKKKNKSYEEKRRTDFEDPNQLVAPVHLNDFGTGESWGMEEILERSFKILNYFSRDLFNDSWDNDI